jgi:group I intron endonuclease
MQKQKHFLIYKITNLINNKIYIGQHVTTNINDDYMGSGEHIKNAIKKYGIENFKKEIIAECLSFEEMNNLEKELVNHEFVQNPNTYNHAIGGSYGWKNCLKYKSEEEIQNIRKNASNAILNLLKDPEYKRQHAEKISKGLKEANFNPKTFLGKTHSEESKRKMSETHKRNNHQKGEKNSQFGTCWIYNLELKVNKKIKKSDLDSWIKLGWIKGRQIFNKFSLLLNK